MIDKKEKARSVIRYWLQQESLTVGELSERVDMEPEYVRKIVRMYIGKKLVEQSGTRLNRSTGKYIREYGWRGKETIEGLMARAAIALRDGADANERALLSVKLLRFLESTDGGDEL